MSLLTTDISKVKRPSLEGVRLPTTDRGVKPTLIQVERPPTGEEITYSKLVTIDPLIEELVELLDLVSTTTGERIRKVELKGEVKAQDIDKPKLIALAQRVIKGENNYSREDVVERIKGATNVTQERAERGFNLILQAGIIKSISGDRYYLTGSTPF